MLYPAYEARMVKALPADRIPQHVGVMLDGNRRWAKAVGADTAHGHRAGAANIEPLLGWCEEVGVEVVTLWLLSTDNLNRPPDELAGLLLGSSRARSTTLADGRPLAAAPRRRARPAAGLDRARLKAAEDATRDVDGLLVNVAVGYGGRREIADAVRSLLQEQASRGTTLEELAEVIDVEHIAEHLYTKGQPDPDLVIRTSGEQRLGGLPALAERAQRVLLLRGLLARLPPGRLPARDPGLRRARAPLRRPDVTGVRFTPRSGVSSDGRSTGVRSGVASGEAGRTGRPGVRVPS